MKNIVGIKLADGSFYPILEEGTASSKLLELTTVRDDQETVQLDLYKAIDGDESNLEYVDTLLIENLLPRQKEEPTLSLTLSVDEDGVLSASIKEAESGESSSLSVSLLNSSEPTQVGSPDFSLTNTGNIPSLSSMTFMDDVPREAEVEGFGDDEFSLPTDDLGFENEDFSFEENTDEIEQETSFESIENEEEIDLPLDVSFDEGETNETEINEDVDNQAELAEDNFPSFSDDIESFDETPDIDNTALETNAEDGFTDSLYDFGDSIDESLETPAIDDADFNTQALDDSIPAPEFSFSDLYDKGDYVEEEKIEEVGEKKSNNTLLIVLLVLILLACLGLFTFLLWGKKEPKTQVEKPKVEQVEENLLAAEPSIDAIVQEENIDTAKDNEIVKLESEIVVPEPVKETAPEAEAILYKIKWGDTLWDISNAYYKTPWLYPKIAAYNGIKNPDYIISGTWITIPPK